MQQTVIRIEREWDAMLVNIEDQLESALGSLDHPSAARTDVLSLISRITRAESRSSTRPSSRTCRSAGEFSVLPLVGSSVKGVFESITSQGDLEADEEGRAKQKRKANRFSTMGGKVGGNGMEVVDSRISSTTSNVANSALPVQLKVRPFPSRYVHVLWVGTDDPSLASTTRSRSPKHGCPPLD
jgi:hypothetical protein